MTGHILVPLPILIPLTGAALALVLWRHERIQRLISVLSLTAALAASTTLLFLADHATLVVDVGAWPPPVGINLVADRLSALMLTISGVVMLAVLLYSLAQGAADGEEEAPVAIFHPTFLILAAGVAIAFLSGDLFNLYVGFEVLLATSYVLITLGGTSERVRAGSVYVVVALASSLVFLVALAVTYAATGTVNMAHLAGRLAGIDPGMRLVIQLLILLAFGVKAAVFPLSAWLPDSYPTAPAPVTAVFAGLLTKVGVYAMVRTQVLMFVPGTANVVLMWLAGATMLVGIAGAVAQDDIKRLLSFTLVSHIGFMVFGIAMASVAGIAGAIFYVVHHITVQTTLFLVAGLVDRRAGSTSLQRLGGLAKAAPGLAVLFFIPALSLAGVPPLSGFVGKLGLLQEGVTRGGGAMALVVASLATSLLTLYAVIKAWNQAFWQTTTATIDAREPLPRSMVAVTTGMVGVGLAITFLAGPLYAYASRAAGGLGAPYIQAVFGTPGVGSGAESALLVPVLPDAGDPPRSIGPPSRSSPVGGLSVEGSPVSGQLVGEP